MAKKVYEKPSFVDLRGLTVSGQQVTPMGDCVSGTGPYPTCGQGTFFEVYGGCSSGTAPDVSRSCMMVGSAAENNCQTGTAPG